MALMTTTKIRINGQEIPYFETLELTQEISEHHQFRVRCRASDLPAEDSGSQDMIGGFKDYIGGAISVEIIPIHQDESLYGDNFQFMGIIVSIDDNWQDIGNSGLITIYASSGTIMADGGGHYNSFHKQSLAFIADETLQGYHRNALDFEINPIHPQLTDEILYSVQDGCTDFEYMRRLAAYYGQWLYSVNGKTLILGAPGTTEVPLEYGKDLKHMRLEMRPVHNQFMYLTDDYLEESGQHQKDTEEVTTSSEQMQQFIYQKASELFPKKRNQYHDSPFHDNPEPRSVLASRFNTQIEEYTKAKALNQVVLVGVSDDPGVRLGNAIRVKGQGRYRIIKVIHTNNHKGEYENHFEAIEASTEVCPKMDLKQTPKSDSQVAVVYDNADPEQLGRIRVQFPWQVNAGKYTPWIRIVTPQAGLDRGAYCIPEIGDEVMINFQGGNAERPYMIGALYTATKTPQAEDASEENVTDNNIKSIRTRSGHSIIFDDTEGAEKLTFHDNEGSIIVFDTQAKSLSIHATENIEIAAKNIAIKAEEHITIQAQGDINTASEGDTTVQAQGTTALQSTGDTTIQSDASIGITAQTDASLTGTNVVAQANNSAELKGNTSATVEGAVTQVKGASHTVNVI